jgi:hypothetical protein
MGAANSVNSSKVVTDAVVNVSNNIIASSILSQTNTQILSLSDVVGNVTITGNVFTQTATVDIHQLLTALVSQETQQTLQLEIEQSAKALISDLNIGQLANAQNLMNVMLTAATNIVSTVASNCAASIQQNQEIQVQHIGGNVLVDNNRISQATTQLSNCVSDVASNNKALQDVSVQLSQASEATAKGVNIWAVLGIVVAVVLCIAAPILVPVVGGASLVIKFVFPVVMITGIVMLIVYGVYTKKIMASTGFASFNGCATTSMGTNTTFTTAGAASDACKNDKGCIAYQWQGMEVTGRTFTNIVPPRTEMFSKTVPKPCHIIQDDVGLLTIPPLEVWATDPSQTTPARPDGTILISNTSFAWYRMTKGVWIKGGTLRDPIPGATISITHIPAYAGLYQHDNSSITELSGLYPGYSGYASQDVLVELSSDCNKFTVSGTGIPTIVVPGPGPLANSPSNFNVVGYKQSQRIAWLLWVGLGLSLAGLAGTIIVNVKKKKHNDMAASNKSIKNSDKSPTKTKEPSGPRDMSIKSRIGRTGSMLRARFSKKQ